MAKTTRMDVYVNGEVVFSYVRGEDNFTANDVEVKVTKSNNFSE